MAKNKGFKKVKTSKIDLDIDEVIESKELQRTEEWKEERRGRWTGSQLTSLMTCDQGAGKMSWDNVDKLFRFGKTALKYIYENAMERKTGRYIDEGDGTQQMRYGTKIEPLIARAAKRELKKFGKLKEVGFKTFPTMKDAGVSSDRILKKDKKVVATVEMKACTNWGTHYERTFDLIDERSKDFWQIQGQTVAWEVDICYYIVAEPPSDIRKYLYYEGDIMDLYEEFLIDCPISVIKVKASKIHQEALLKRICISEQALNDWLASGGNLSKILDSTIAFFHKNQDKLNEYVPALGLASATKRSQDAALKLIHENTAKRGRRVIDPKPKKKIIVKKRKVKKN